MEASEQVVSHLSANMNLSKKDIIVGNFLGGLAWGAGTVLGAIVIGAIIFYTLKPLGIFDLLVGPSQELTPLRPASQKLK